MPKKYRKKSVVIEALQVVYGKTEVSEVEDFLGNSDIRYKDHETGKEYIKTLEGDMLISDGDYIIKGIQGEFYPCKPDIFEASYDAATSNVGNLTVNVNFESLGTDIDKVVAEISKRMEKEISEGATGAY